MNAEELKDRDAYVDECFAQITAQKGVETVIVMNENWDPIKSTLLVQQDSLDYTGLFGSLLFKSRRAVKLINERDELLEIRVHTKKHEVILTPDEKIVFITIQKPVDLYEKQE